MANPPESSELETAVLLTLLAESGVVRLEAEYASGILGDDKVSAIYAYGAKGEVHVPYHTRLEKWFSAVIDAQLTHTYPDWKDEANSYGEMFYNVDAGELSWNHTQGRIVYETTHGTSAL